MGTNKLRRNAALRRVPPSICRNRVILTGNLHLLSILSDSDDYLM